MMCYGLNSKHFTVNFLVHILERELRGLRVRDREEGLLKTIREAIKIEERVVWNFPCFFEVVGNN